jgi:DNA-binding LacI/PurR family transcriptional regulator
MVRLKDIAERADVSVMTVSKALRDARDISAATKARIQLLARQMGYVPDSMAQGLRSRTTKLLGLVISAMTNPVFARTVLAIEERAHALGYDLILAHTLNETEREESCLRRLLSRRVDGLLIFPVYRLIPSSRIYEELRLRGTPTVILGQTAPFCSGFTNVETDDLNASYSATRHLIELGHKQIAYFTGPPASPAAAERLDGYRRALREARIESDDRLVFTAGSTIEEGQRAAAQMLEEHSAVTAVQTFNDLVAIGAGTLFLERGMRIPRDISLVGFGNILISEHFRVPLTTVRQPKHRLGIAAMEAMAKLLRHETVEPSRLSAEIVVRSSTSPPGKENSADPS